MSIEDEYKERLREAKEAGTLEEGLSRLCYEVGHAHGRGDRSFRNVGWEDVVEWKQEIEEER